MPLWSIPTTSAPTATDPADRAVCDSMDTDSSTIYGLRRVPPGATPMIVLSSCGRREVDGLEDRRGPEEVEIDRLVGMPGDLLGDERNAETRSIGDREVAVDDAWAPFDDGIAPVGIPGREHLLDERVRRDGVNH